MTSEERVGERSEATDRASGPAAREPRERAERALSAVRREGWKAAAVYAVVDGTLAFVLVNLAVTVTGTDAAALAVGPLPGRVVAALAVGLLVAGTEFGLRIRRPLVERFGEANPDVAEALRTARDAVARGRDDPMARRLYADTRERLLDASSRGLIDARRVAATVFLVLCLGAVTVQASAAGVVLLDDSPDGSEGANGGGVPSAATPTPDGYDGLQDGDGVLGTPGDVTRGDENESADVGTNPDPEGQRTPSDGEFDTGGYADSGSYDAQRAGFAGEDPVADADIVRAYSVRIRNASDA